MPVDPMLTLALLLLQVPPVVASCSAMALPTHTLVVPVIAAGAGFTLTIALPVILVIQDGVAVYTPFTV